MPQCAGMRESGPDRIERQLRCLACGVCRPAMPVSADSDRLTAIFTLKSKFGVKMHMSYLRVPSTNRSRLRLAGSICPEIPDETHR